MPWWGSLEAKQFISRFRHARSKNIGACVGVFSTCASAQTCPHRRLCQEIPARTPNYSLVSVWLIGIAVYARKYLQGPQTSLVYRAQAQKKSAQLGKMVWGLIWLSI